jgi:hypothetical protein
MKMRGIKSFALIMSCTLGLISCSKKESAGPNNTTPSVNIEQKNRALVIDITGTWCPPCGAYGIPGFNDAIAKGKDKILPIAIHSNDPLSLTAMNAVSNLPRFKSNSVPRIVVGNGLTFANGVYSDIAATGNKIIASVDTFLANNPVVVGVALNNLKIADGKISVDAHSKFFDTNANGEYLLSVYFYENGVISTQQISNAPANVNQQHDYVIRAVSTASAWGSVIPITGDVTSKTYTSLLNPAWKTENMGAIVVVWKKIGSDYLYVNGTLTSMN